MSAIGAYYYLKVLVYLFMKSPEAGAPVAVPMKSMYVVSALILAGYFVVRMGLAPAAYVQVATSAANQMAGIADEVPADEAPAAEAVAQAE
jgi:NADH-quinone oxidoreductase subunit N